jgi:hypothetical protein
MHSGGGAWSLKLDKLEQGLWDGHKERSNRQIYSVGCLVISGMEWEGGLSCSGITVYLSRRSNACCAVVQGEHRLPSGGPQLQALACTLADASRLEHTSQFGTMEPCPSPTAAS